MNCKNCKEKIDDDSKFCPSCGEKVEKTDKSSITNVEKEILEHLEFLGYEVNKSSVTGDLQRYSAIHKTKPNLVFNAVTDVGVSFVTFYILDKDKVKKNYQEALELINRVNNVALLCNFSISPDSETFVCGALYLGKYNKKQFADFLDLFASDIQNRLKSEGYLENFS